MSDVSGRHLGELLRRLEVLGINVDALVGDLTIDWADYRRSHPLVEWDVFAELMGRLSRCVGGPKGLEELGARLADLQPAPMLRRLAGLSASPLRLYQAARRWTLAHAVPDLETRLEQLEDGRIRIVAQLPENRRECPELLHLATGGARSLPRLIDLPDAVVSAEITGRTAVFSILPPPSGTFVARARRAVRAYLSTRSALRLLEGRRMELQSHFDALRHSFAELRASESLHRTLTHSLHDVMLELSPEGRVLFASPSVEELMGYRRDQILGSHFALWLHRADVPEARDGFESAIAGDDASPTKALLRVRHCDGEWIWVDVIGRRFESAEGEPHIVVVVRNFDERMQQAVHFEQERAELEQVIERSTGQLERRNRDLRELQALLLENERHGAARDLAGLMANSISHPLDELIDNLEAAVDKDEYHEPTLQRSLVLARQLGSVVSRTVQLHRKGKLDRGWVDPTELMRQLERDLAPRAERVGIELACRIDADVPQFEADRDLLLSGLLSIAEGAIDAMPGGGGLGVELRSPAPDAIEIDVWDTRPDHPEPPSENALETLLSNDRSGAHLGLSIARTVVRAHDGRLDETRHADGGILVRVVLPRNELRFGRGLDES